MIRTPPPPGTMPLGLKLYFWFVIALVAISLLSGCTSTRNLPPPAPLIQKVLVPVSQPCQVEQVTNSPLPSAGGVPLDIFEAVKRVLADRAILLGDREKLQAANSDPCP
jgi:hypothetical protein